VCNDKVKRPRLPLESLPIPRCQIHRLLLSQ
jgi:hypothetical protein